MKKKSAKRWQVVESTAFGFEVKAEDKRAVAMVGQGPLAETDAKLIAAAPLMFEVLKEALKDIEDGIGADHLEHKMKMALNIARGWKP